MSDDLTDRLQQPCPVAIGSRIRLVRMSDDPLPIEPGACGQVTGGNGAQIWVDWDDGRSLMLLPDVDQWEVVR